jgi:hypothetical protein
MGATVGEEFREWAERRLAKQPRHRVSIVGRVDASEALDELTRLSLEIEGAAILDSSGAPLAVTSGADGDRLARAAAELLDIAAIVHPDRTVERVDVRLSSRGVFVVRGGDRVAVATTRPEPPAALVVHDLRACLARIDSAPGTAPTRKRKHDQVDA